MRNLIILTISQLFAGNFIQEYPLKPMRFVHQGKGIYVTVDTVKMKPVLIVYTENNIDLKEISIGFIDGTIEIFKDFTQQGTLFRFNLNPNQTHKLRRIKFDQIVFDCSNMLLPCVQIINKEYFILALKNYGIK